MYVDLIKSFRFEAAHHNPKGDEVTSRLHGHGYRVDVLVGGHVDSKLGWLVDYGQITDLFAPIHDALDHRCLNDVEGLADTSLPGLRRWIHERLAPGLEQLEDVRVRIVGDLAFQPVVLEPATGYEEVGRVAFTFEAAHALPELPPEHKCSRMHGHSFRVEIGAPEIHGGREGLRELYDALDHRCLNAIRGLENPTSEHVCKWIWERLAARDKPLTVITLAETCTAKAVYRGQ